MFRLEFLVEDKNLHKVLHALTGLVLNMSPPQSVTNAIVTKGKAKQVVQASTESSMSGRLSEVLRASFKGQRVSSEQLKDLITQVGGNVSSISTFRTYLFNNEIIESVGRGQYKVL